MRRVNCYFIADILTEVLQKCFNISLYKKYVFYCHCLLCFCCYGNLMFPLTYNGKSENWPLSLSHCRYFDKSFTEIVWPGAVARSEACPLGMQMAPSSISTSGTFFRGDLVVKKFLRPYSLFRWFKKSSCQLLATECALSTGKLPMRLAQEQCG